MQDMPDGDEAAEFSEVLKSFYKVVYEGHDEQVPAILRIFQNEIAQQKIKLKEDLKSNGHHVPKHKNRPNGYIEIPDLNGEHEEIPANVNGVQRQDSVPIEQFPHRDSLDLRNKGVAGFLHHDSLDLRNKEAHELNGLQFSNGVNPVLIISPDEFKKSEKAEEDDSGFQNGTCEGTCTCIQL